MLTMAKQLKWFKRQVKWVKVCRDSFATDEDWETVCEEVNADPESTTSIKLYISKVEVESE